MRALVTGATGGIGEAIIDLLIEKNYEVIALGRNITKLLELEERYYNKLKGYSINLDSEKEIDTFLEKNKDLSIDLVINGAGIGEIDYFENIPYSSLKKMIDINIIALTKFSKFYYDTMVKKNKGVIVNISSTAGFQQGGPLMSVYYATKSFVNSLTLSLYEEGKERGIKVFLLAPGPTKTNFKGMDRELSFFEKLYVTTPKEVATELMEGIEKDKFVIIPGKINKILSFFDKLIPLSIKLKSIKKIQEKKLKK